MDLPGSTPLTVEALRTRLRARIAALGGEVVVGDVTRAFLEVSSEPADPPVWSLEFMFDEDDSRIACLEARFGDGLAAERAGIELRGYAVRILLPKLLPKATFDRAIPSPHLRAMADERESLAARFVRALDELGAYRLIEGLGFRAVDVELRG